MAKCYLFILFTIWGPKTDNSKTASHEKHVPIFCILVVMVIVSNIRNSFVIIRPRTVCLCLRWRYFRTDRRGNYKLGEKNQYAINIPRLAFVSFFEPSIITRLQWTGCAQSRFLWSLEAAGHKGNYFLWFVPHGRLFLPFFFCLLPQVINSQPTKPRKKTVIPL